MKYRSSSLVLMTVALLGLGAVAQAEYDWHWWPRQLLQASEADDNIWLADNNGGRALAYGVYNGERAVIAYSLAGQAYVVRVDNGVPRDNEQPNTDQPCEDGNAVTAVSFGAGTPQKMVVWPSYDYDDNPVVAYADTDLTASPQDNWDDCFPVDNLCVPRCGDGGSALRRPTGWHTRLYLRLLLPSLPGRLRRYHPQA